MKPFIREDLLPVIASTPEQTTWDLSALRTSGDELFAAVVPDLTGVDLRVEHVLYACDVSMCSADRAEAAAAGGVPASNLGELELRCFTPVASTPLSAVIVSIHGGGYVCGRARFDDEKNAEMAARLGAVVISPDYRLAPEHPFPAGVEDCVTALVAAGECARKHGVPLYVFGDSAGAGSAYYSALLYRERLRENGDDACGSSLSGVILLEPCLDPRADTPSFSAYADGPIWTQRAAVTAWEHTAPTPQARAQLVDMLENPARLQECAPTLIVVNPVDPLRDEGISLATALADAGVPTELHMYAGTFHGALSVKNHPVWNEILAIVKRFIGVSA